MAQVYTHTLPPTPPPPVFSVAPVRSQSPQAHHRPDLLETRKSSYGTPLQSPPLTSPPQPPTHARISDGKMTTMSPRRPAPVQVDPSESSALSAEIPPEPEHLSPILSSFPRHIFSDSASRSSSPSQSGRAVSRGNGYSLPEIDINSEAKPSEVYEPLSYHHQIQEDQELAKRASKLTVGTAGSGASSETAQLAYQNLRQSYLGADLQRPDSVGDRRGRQLSPHGSPMLRPDSQHSRSPSARPVSYVDLLNVPYPQQAPNVAEKLVNQGLRTAVGENASLMSTRKTLDMYRMNVKKTNDPAIQYEFAVFMISAAQEAGLEEEQMQSSNASQNSAKSGTPVPKSIKDDLMKEAKVILQRLCDKSYPFAQYYLADAHSSGLFTNGRSDPDRAFPLFHAAAKHGHAEAMYRTALCYEFGWGCRVDGAKAVQFYQHAASKNHPGAMLRLGRACLNGEMGLTKRYREGIRWLKRGSESADLQYNQAPFDLACLHEDGYGPDVFKDESYAAQLYTKAADLGHRDAAFRLGEAYEYGQLSCPTDPALSVHFYTGAAEQGHPQAQMALCAWYMVGVDGVLEKDETEAYMWARVAAEQGLPKAQYTLGYFTEMGIGCRRDPLEANVWYVQAADQGEERAKHRISAIRRAAGGADPMTAAAKKPQKKKSKNNLLADASTDGKDDINGDMKKKKFGLF